MKVARYWVKKRFSLPCADGIVRDILARGWSERSDDEATARAHERAKRAASQIGAVQSKDNARSREYEYAAAPLPEPIVETLTSPDGQTSAQITRNGYGARVLNSDSIMFVDLDLPEQQPNRGFFASFFKGVPSRSEREEMIIRKIRAAVLSDRTLGVRLYRTHSGMRLLVTSRQIVATSEEAQILMRALGADPLYTKLCRSQESFRARLTPKPWRCECEKPKVHFPLVTEAEKQSFREWEEEYETVAKDYSVCEFISDFGVVESTPGIQPIVDYHDRETGVGSGRPLA